MKYGYWLPVFGGWLRNVEDEGMVASWEYVKRLAQRSEEIGYDINALSNFVADAPNVIGFDPFVRLVDYLEGRGAQGAGRAAGSRPASRVPRPALAEVGP